MTVSSNVILFFAALVVALILAVASVATMTPAVTGTPAPQPGPAVIYIQEVSHG